MAERSEQELRRIAEQYYLQFRVTGPYILQTLLPAFLRSRGIELDADQLNRVWDYIQEVKSEEDTLSEMKVPTKAEKEVAINSWVDDTIEKYGEDFKSLRPERARIRMFLQNKKVSFNEVQLKALMKRLREMNEPRERFGWGARLNRRRSEWVQDIMENHFDEIKDLSSEELRIYLLHIERSYSEEGFIALRKELREEKVRRQRGNRNPQ